MDQQPLSPHDLFTTQQSVITEKTKCLNDKSQNGWSDNVEENNGNVEDFDDSYKPSQRTNSRDSTLYTITQPVVTEQPVREIINDNQSYEDIMTAHNFSRITKRKKPIFPAGKEHKRSITCYKNAEDMQPHQIDMCPQIWFRNCCTWQDLVEDANAPTRDNTIARALPRISTEMQTSSTENVKMKKGTIANRICWRACFVSLCLPTCYPCYICRTVRRSRRQGDILRREELLKHDKNEKMLKNTNDSLNGTLFTQISEVKNRNKTASLEHQMKAHIDDTNLNSIETNGNLNSASKLNAVLEKKIDNDDTNINENVTKNDNKDASTDAEVDVVLRKNSLQNQNSGDKSSKRSNLMNVNVIVLESKYSQIFHSNLSKKIEGISNK